MLGISQQHCELNSVNMSRTASKFYPPELLRDLLERVDLMLYLRVEATCSRPAVQLSGITSCLFMPTSAACLGDFVTWISTGGKSCRNRMHHAGKF
jgi:hypothetical protein